MLKMLVMYLTLTSVVFELFCFSQYFFYIWNLTLTSVVFEYPDAKTIFDSHAI